MPRPKVVNRKRVVKACTQCKKRKEKCDGLQPCSRCTRRSREQECTFQDIDTSTGTLEALTTPISSQAKVPDAQPKTMTERSRSVSSHVGSSRSLSVTETAISAPVPELSRFLQDPKGKFIYIGDSASLSFLQTLRRIADSSIGASHFTTDVLRHEFIETSSHVQASDVTFSRYLPDLDEALDLIRNFTLSVSGALDLFDEAYITEDIYAWLQDPMRSTWSKSCIIELVLALGAQARALNSLDDVFAEQFFISGRKQAMRSLIDNPSLTTVQAFSLIAWYMLTACRRNGALMNLGFAVQAAYALGIHRHEANISFGARIATSRERVWKTLRVCDLFLSASMGRPSITSCTDANVLSGIACSADKNDRLASAMARICLIFERILSEVYARGAISLVLASSISEQHRRWTEALPELLEADGLSPEGVAGPVDLPKTVGSAVVVMAYHYSIILLTRPFLTLEVNSYINKKDRMSDQPNVGSSISTYSNACVTSAINSIATARGMLCYDALPKRLPLVVNSMFIAALVIGLAYFGDYHCRGWALDQNLEQAISVMKHFAAHSPQPARYQQILEFLHDAIVKYKDHHQETKMRDYNQNVSNVFGDISAHLDRGRMAIIHSTVYHPNKLRSSTSASKAMDYDKMLSDPFASIYDSLEAIPSDLLITTSGNLAPTQSGLGSTQISQSFDGDGQFSTFTDSLFTDAAGDCFAMGESSLYTLMQD